MSNLNDNQPVADPALFFDYRCDQCGQPYCERVNVMNLTLGYTEEAYCLSCLGMRHHLDEPAMADFCWEYVQSRDCFKNPWMAFDASVCPKLPVQQCYCQKEIA